MVTLKNEMICAQLRSVPPKEVDSGCARNLENFIASALKWSNSDMSQALIDPLVKPLMNWRIATAKTQSSGIDEMT